MSATDTIEKLLESLNESVRLSSKALDEKIEEAGAEAWNEALEHTSKMQKMRDEGRPMDAELYLKNLNDKAKADGSPD